MYALVEGDPFFEANEKEIDRCVRAFTNSVRVDESLLLSAPHCVELSFWAQGWRLAVTPIRLDPSVKDIYALSFATVFLQVLRMNKCRLVGQPSAGLYCFSHVTACEFVESSSWRRMSSLLPQQTLSLLGSNAVWRLDMRPEESKNGNVYASAHLSLSARIPSAQVLNGMTQLAKNDTSHVLISDSAAGNILRLNVVTGEEVVVISDPTMLPRSDGINVGVNGIHVWGDQLFYTSLDQGIFAKVRISLSTGVAKGPVDIILNGTLQAADDFTLSRDGLTAWITEYGEFVLVEVDILSKTSRIALNDTLLASTSSAALGRSCSNLNSIYITGAHLNANGTAVQGRVFEAKLDTLL
ncbi:hypothetical protein OCU04_001532 [Sclerotinia nivalis]|uniref:Uncharacterized protein n=1 Tax=Sclerotinia nivalis TaxID=352851 RepID=A0A9X0DPT2_9HELO|nr:hypothetical protein OCU04_001532 [Sclerotinia nivalis]